MMNILIANNIYYTPKSSGNLFGKTIIPSILNGVSITVPQNEITAITGESGSGKTTLAKILSGILQQTGGTVIYNTGKKNNRKPVQLLFQNNEDIINPFRKVVDIIEEGFLIDDPSCNSKVKTEILLDLLELPESIKNKKGCRLSGGERQRVALGRLLAVNPEILILDEPFSAQDLESQKNLIELIKKIRDEYRKTFICISHNLKVLKKLADTIHVMKNGKIVESGTMEQVISLPRDPYTQFLLKAESLELTEEELLYE